MKVAETFGKGIGELVRAKRILGISSVFGPAGERGAFAEILAFADTVLARSTRLVQPRNAHSCARLKPPRIRTALFHGTHHLVAGDQWTLPRRQLSFNHMQVGAADPAHANPDQHLIPWGFGTGNSVRRSGLDSTGAGAGKMQAFMFVFSRHRLAAMVEVLSFRVWPSGSWWR